MNYVKTIAAGCVLYMAALMIGPSAAADDSSGALLKATPGHIEVGKVEEGKLVEVTTIIQNMGKTKVEITNVKTS